MVLAAVLLVGGSRVIGQDANRVARGADELYWVPTLEQGLEMSAVTGRPIFLMGYSLVGDGATYTKTGDAACSGVY